VRNGKKVFFETKNVKKALAKWEGFVIYYII